MVCVLVLTSINVLVTPDLSRLSSLHRISLSFESFCFGLRIKVSYTLVIQDLSDQPNTCLALYQPLCEGEVRRIKAPDCQELKAGFWDKEDK